MFCPAVACLVWIPAKELDVVPDPDERLPLVPEPLVSRQPCLGGGQEPEGPQAVVDGHQHHPVVQQELWADVGVAGTRFQGSAVDEELKRRAVLLEHF